MTMTTTTTTTATMTTLTPEDVSTTSTLERQEEYLAFVRNAFLQTPRPLGGTTATTTAIDRIWDGPTAEKFRASVDDDDDNAGRAARTTTTAATTSSSGGGGRRGKRRRTGRGAPSSNHDRTTTTTAAAAAARSDGGRSERANDDVPAERRSRPRPRLPLCGLEDDERALSYLEAHHRGDARDAELSVVVDADRGYGVQRRRQAKKRRKEAAADGSYYPDATAFSSESWRWRVHQARPVMLGDFRSGRDPTYPYYDPAPADVSAAAAADGSVDVGRPWRLRRRDGDGDDDNDDDGATTTTDGAPAAVGGRPRSFSLSWSEEEIETARRIWRTILAYTNGILGGMTEANNGAAAAAARKNGAKPRLRDLIELAGKAHALPTPEEAFGRRDPSARQMSENMNGVVDSIEAGRDAAARILKRLEDDGEGIELDALRGAMDDVERSCPVGLSELDAARRRIREATLWEEKLENDATTVERAAAGGTSENSDAASDNNDGEEEEDDVAITEKKLTLEKVERLASEGRDLALRPASLVRLRDRIRRAHALRREISAWNESRGGGGGSGGGGRENEKNIKHASALIKRANKIDLAFPELFTLTGVHKKAEEWMDRASIAARTTISREELESLVAAGDSLPLNVSDVLERLRTRLERAREWTARLEEIVPPPSSSSSGGDGGEEEGKRPLEWLRRFRTALEDEEDCSRLLSLLAEASRIPVTMECSVVLQIEIDARHWAARARPWIPENLDDAPGGEVGAPQKRGRIDDVKDHLRRASSLRDRLWFGEEEKRQWVLDGESQLAKMITMAEAWFEKHNDVLNYDSRRNGKLRISTSNLHTIVKEVNQIPLNVGNPSTKMNRIYSQAEEWMKEYHPLLKRCGVECTYVPTCGDAASEDSSKPLKISELSSAVADAESNVSVDLEEVVEMRELLERARNWIAKVNAIAPKKDPRKKGKQQQDKHSMTEISNLIDESPTILVDIADELERLQIEQSTTLSWRLQAQQTLRRLMTAFDNFRVERAAPVGDSAESNGSASDALSTGQTSVANSMSESMTTRNINSRRRALSNAGSSGSETPAYTEKGGKQLFTLLSNFLKSVKSMNTLTPEGSVANELSEVMSWFTKTFKLMNSPSDIYDRKNFSKLDKLIESGENLVNSDSVTMEQIPEDTKLVDNLRQSWAAAVKDDTARLLDLQKQRNDFVEWCENADAIVSSTDKKVSIDTLKELLAQSASFPSSSDIVLRVRKRAKDSIAWVDSMAEILKTGKKIPLDEAKAMTDAGDKLNISCSEYKTLRAALRATRGWLLRAKKCGAANGQLQVASNLVTELINEHNTFLVTAMDTFSELKQIMCGYCVCRQPYEGFMIGCDGCDEWYHGPCVGISQEQAQKFDKYVCVRCSTLRVYKDNAATVAGILRKWTSAKGVTKARSGDSQRYGRKVRSAERDIVKAKAGLEKFERELNTLLAVASNAQPQSNGEAAASNATSQTADSSSSVASQGTTNAKVGKSEKALRDKIGKAHTIIGNCEKRMEGYKVELVERKNLETREDALALNLKKWCATVKREVLSPATTEEAELSRPRNDGSTSAPMDRATKYAETLGIAKLPDIDAVLNSFKIFSWCLHSLCVLMRKPRVEEIRSLLSHSDSGYFKLPEAKCVRMLRSMSSRAQIWQSKANKALAPVPNETKPYDLAILRELLLAAKQIPLLMPEETRLWSTIEDGGNRHCICGGPSDGSFMLGCDSCDRWFHGSCMKIDKETSDALPKWICPPCSKSLSVEAVKVEEHHATAVDQKLPAQETNLPQSIQPPLARPYHDISPHAPNPVLLWPPFGLRSSKQAGEALGTVGESDNEDFQAPIQPTVRVKSASNANPQNPVTQGASTASLTTASALHARVKPDSKAYPQHYAPQRAPTVRSTTASVSHAKVKSVTNAYHLNHVSQGTLPTNSAIPSVSHARTKPDAKPYPQHHVPQGALLARSTTAAVSRFPLCQPIGAHNSGSNSYPQRNVSRVTSLAAAPNVFGAPTHHPRAGNAQAMHRDVHKTPGVSGNPRPNHSVALKTNHQQIASTQVPFAQYPPGTNALSSITPYTSTASVHHTPSYRSEQRITNPVNSISLNGSNLSVAVANMDHYVLSSGDGARLQHVSNAPLPGVAAGPAVSLPTNSAMQVAVPKNAPMKSSNCQSYAARAFSQSTPKAP